MRAPDSNTNIISIFNRRKCRLIFNVNGYFSVATTADVTVGYQPVEQEQREQIIVQYPILLFQLDQLLEPHLLHQLMITYEGNETGIVAIELYLEDLQQRMAHNLLQ